MDKINHSKMIKKETESNILNEPLMLGEEVKVLSLNENGYVQTLPDKNGNLQVKIGILKVNANISDIIRIEKVINNSKEKYLILKLLLLRVIKCIIIR